MDFSDSDSDLDWLFDSDSSDCEEFNEDILDQGKFSPFYVNMIVSTWQRGTVIDKYLYLEAKIFKVNAIYQKFLNFREKFPRMFLVLISWVQESFCSWFLKW